MENGSRVVVVWEGGTTMSALSIRDDIGPEELRRRARRERSTAHKTGALAARDLERVVVDTTVQPKAIAHPTDARLCHRPLEKLVDFARHHHVPLGQSYRRVAKRAAIMGRALHNRTSSSGPGTRSSSCAFWLGRVIRGICRIADNEALKERSADLLALAVRVRLQDHGNATPRSMRCTPPRSNASARAKPARRMSSAARCRWRPRLPSQRRPVFAARQGTARQPL
jgi:IS5 family transposase